MTEEDAKKLKMYIVVKQSLPSHKVVATAHGVLMCYLKFIDYPPMQEWLKHSFRKVIVEATDEQFAKMREYGDKVIVTESGLGGIEVALAFAPKLPWECGKEFRNLSMLRV
jgi:hypothetical protein